MNQNNPVDQVRRLVLGVHPPRGPGQLGGCADGHLGQRLRRHLRRDPGQLGRCRLHPVHRPFHQLGTSGALHAVHVCFSIYFRCLRLVLFFFVWSFWNALRNSRVHCYQALYHSSTQKRSDVSGFSPFLVGSEFRACKAFRHDSVRALERSADNTPCAHAQQAHVQQAHDMNPANC